MNVDKLLEDSETSDDDYVPDENPEVVSEEESDGNAESDGEEHKNKKRTKRQGKTQNKQKKIENTIGGEVVDEAVNSKKEDNNDDKKKLADDIWADFLKDTGFQTKKCLSSTVKKDHLEKDTSMQSSVTKPPEKVKITQLFEFAGEEVQVEKEVPVDSAEARLLSKPEIAPKRSRGGLSGISTVLSNLGKKPKISTLEKSKLDWDKFKKEENLEEELQTHNKGKDGYLEKQDFLQRADLRRFEIEKKLRAIDRNRRLNN